MSILSNLIKGVTGYKASRDANANSKRSYEGQLTANDRISDEYDRVDRSVSEALAPWKATGMAGRGVMNNMLYGNAEQVQSALEATPGYQASLNAGIRARDASAASRGQLLSGAQEKELATYTADHLNQQYDRYLDRYRPDADLGWEAARAGMAHDMGMASAYGDLHQREADSLAAYYSAKNGQKGNQVASIAGTIGGIEGSKDGATMMQMAKMFMGGG